MHRLLQGGFSSFSGSLHPRAVACAAALGLLAGMVSGWNLTLAAVLLAVLALNVPLRVFAQTWLAAALVSLAITPVTYSLGRSLLAHGFGSAIAPLADSTLFLLFDFDRYTLVGGIAAAALLAIPAAWLAARATAVLEGHFRRWREAVAAGTPFEAASHIRFACWLIFGDAARPAPVAVTRWTRPRGVSLSLAIAVTGVGMGWWFGPGMVERELLQTLCVANQAEVNAAQVSLSMSDGLLQIADLQLADPNQLDRDRLRIGAVAAQVSPGGLLRGRVTIDRLVLDDVRCDVARSSRARPFGVSVPKFDALTPVEDSAARAESDIHLDQCLAQWEPLREQLARLQTLIEKIEQLAATESHDAASGGYLAARSLRHDFGRNPARICVEQITINGLSPQFGLGGHASLHIAHLSSRPNESSPTRLALSAPEVATEMVATLHLAKPDSRHELQFRCGNLDLTRLIQPHGTRQAVAIQRGKLAVAGQGWGNGDDLELNLTLHARDLDVQVLGDRKLAGLTPEVWNQGLQRLAELRAQGVLYGRWTAPRLRIDSQALISQYKSRLRDAGEQQLVQAIDEQAPAAAASRYRDIEPTPPAQLADAPAATRPAASAQHNPLAPPALPAGYGEPLAGTAPSSDVEQPLPLNEAPAARTAQLPADAGTARHELPPTDRHEMPPTHVGPRYANLPPAQPFDVAASAAAQPQPLPLEQPESHPAATHHPLAQLPPGVNEAPAAEPQHIVAPMGIASTPNPPAATVPAATLPAASTRAASTPVAGMPDEPRYNVQPTPEELRRQAERDFGPATVSAAEMQPAPAAAQADLQYPHSLRQGGSPADSVLADMMETSRETVAAQRQSAEQHAGQPLSQEQPLESEAVPAEFQAPPAIGMELGYEQRRSPVVRPATAPEERPLAASPFDQHPSETQTSRRPANGASQFANRPASGQHVTEQPAAAGRSAAGSHQPTHDPPFATAQPATRQHHTAGVAESGAESATDESKLRTWSRGVTTRVSGVTNRVKSMMPWKKN